MWLIKTDSLIRGTRPVITNNPLGCTKFFRIAGDNGSQPCMFSTYPCLPASEWQNKPHKMVISDGGAGNVEKQHDIMSGTTWNMQMQFATIFFVMKQNRNKSMSRRSSNKRSSSQHFLNFMAWTLGLTKSSQGWPGLVSQVWPGSDMFYGTKKNEKFNSCWLHLKCLRK